MVEVVVMQGVGAQRALVAAPVFTFIGVLKYVQ